LRSWFSVQIRGEDHAIRNTTGFKSATEKIFLLVMQVRFPKSISQEAKDLLGGLLIKDPFTRLGGGPEDAE
jgi:hypothetical protein